MLTLLLGCSKDGMQNAIPYEVIHETHLSYADSEILPNQYDLVTSKSEWNDFLDQIARVSPSRAAVLEDLETDFQNHDLIVIIGKYFNYCCSELIVEGVFQAADHVMVQYKESDPGMAAAVSQALTLLKIPKA